MLHSIKFIAENYSKISNLRNDKKRFIAQDFIKFAIDNEEKYKLVKNSDTEYSVSTWYSGDLIEAYQKTL